METEKPKIEFYRERSFGEKLSVSFDFIRENWKPLLKLTTYLMLPLCVIQSFLMNKSMDVSLYGVAEAESLLDSINPMLWVYNSCFLLVAILGGILITSLIFALIQAYTEREEGLKGVTLSSLKPKLVHGSLKLLGISLLSILIIVVFYSLVLGAIALIAPNSEALAVVGMVLATFFILLLALPLILWAPTCLLGGQGIFASLFKAFRIGLLTWGGLFLVILIMGLMSSILQGVCALPWYIAFAVKSLLSMGVVESGEASSSLGYEFVLYLLGIIEVYGSYLASIFVWVGIAFHYGHAVEKTDSVKIEEDIENFEKLS